MRKSVFSSAILIAAVIGGSAMAGDVRAEDPGTITGVLFDEGIASKVDTDSYGDPLVQFRKDDRQYTIFFYNCTDNKDCSNIQVYIGYDTNGDVGVDVTNKMNVDNRFVTAAVDEEDDVVLTMDVMTGENGLADGDFKDLLDLFVNTAKDFEDRVGWVSD